MRGLFFIGLLLLEVDLYATLAGWEAHGLVDANPLIARGISRGAGPETLLLSFAVQAVLLAGASWLAVRWRSRWHLSPWLVLGTAHAVGALTWVLAALPGWVPAAVLDPVYWYSIPGAWLALEKFGHRLLRRDGALSW